MSAPFEQVHVDPRCLVNHCEKQGCALRLEDAPKPFCLIDMDHPQSPARGKRCDYLFIGEGDEGVDLCVVPLELKSSGINPATAVRQLQGGSKVAERITPRVQSRFVPVVAHERSHRSEIHRLAKRRVMFRGGNYAVKVMRCGDLLSKALSPNPRLRNR